MGVLPGQAPRRGRTQARRQAEASGGRFVDSLQFRPYSIEVDQFETPDGTILLAYRGSIAHGMYVPKSDPESIDDVDLIGFVIPEAKYYIGLSEWGSRGTQDYWRGQHDYVFYELRKAVSLLLRGNPNVVSVLWLRPEHYLFLSDAGRALLDHRHLFVGKHVYDAFAGYAQTQLEKM